MGIREWFGFAPSAPVEAASPWSDPSHLETITLAHLHDLDADHLPITRSSAMAIPAVARARNALTAAAGSLPLVAMTDARPHPVPTTPAPWLTKQPELGRPRFTTIAWTVDHLMFYGCAWWVITERDHLDRPRRFEFAPAHAVGWDNGSPVTLNGRRVPARDWIRIDAHHEGVLTYGRAALRSALRIESAAARAADNPVPSIELHQTTPQPLAPEKIDELVTSWAQARRGRNGGVAYTNSAVEVRTHGQAAEQLLISARTQSALDIARVIGVPAWVVDAQTDGSSLTYSNVPSRSRELVDYGLRPYLDAIAARLSMDDILPRGTWCRFDTNHLLQGDLLARAEAAKAAQEAGLLTQAECRALEHGGPVETTDEGDTQ